MLSQSMNGTEQGIEKEITSTLTFSAALPGTLVAASRRLITSWRKVQLQPLQSKYIMHYHSKGLSEFLATGEKKKTFSFHSI